MEPGSAIDAATPTHEAKLFCGLKAQFTPKILSGAFVHHPSSDHDKTSAQLELAFDAQAGVPSGHQLIDPIDVSGLGTPLRQSVQAPNPGGYPNDDINAVTIEALNCSLY
jgi:hypothetical protein